MNNKLCSIKVILGKWRKSLRIIKQEEVILSRLCIGHTHLTHSYLLKEDQPMCSIYQATLTVIHILTECTHLVPVRHKYYENNIKNLFENIEINKMYLKAINIYKKKIWRNLQNKTIYKVYIYIYIYIYEEKSSINFFIVFLINKYLPTISSQTKVLILITHKGRYVIKPNNQIQSYRVSHTSSLLPQLGLVNNYLRASLGVMVSKLITKINY